MSSPSRPSWVRWASSTITTMLGRSLSSPASANRKMVVTMMPRESSRSSRRRSSFVSATRSPGSPTEANSDATCSMRSSRSRTMRMVGASRSCCWRRRAAANAMSSVLPEPWWCHTRPCRSVRVADAGDDGLDGLDLRVARDDLDRVAAGGGRAPRVQGVGPDDVEQHLGAEQQFHRAQDRGEPGERQLVGRPRPRQPHLGGLAHGAVAELLALGGEREDVGRRRSRAS